MDLVPESLHSVPIPRVQESGPGGAHPTLFSINLDPLHARPRPRRSPEVATLLGVIGGEGLPDGGSEGDEAGTPKPGSPGWLRRAERLITSLTGVVSARVVLNQSGHVDEIHVLATDEVVPKQVVRNVQSALIAELETRVDHRKISVAPLDPPGVVTRPRDIRELAPDAPGGAGAAPESERGPTKRFGVPAPDPAAHAAGQPYRSRAGSPRPRPDAFAPVESTSGSTGHLDPAAAPAGYRILFLGHGVDSIRSQRLRLRVALDWKGRRYVGESQALDLVRSRTEGFAAATLRGLERVLDPEGRGAAAAGSLSLDGVRIIKAFERQFVVVAVSAFLGGRHTALTGAAAVGDSLDRAVILSTLQATDRRVRAFLNGQEASRETSGISDEGNPFDVPE